MQYKPYSALAQIYERVISGEDYRKWADYLVSLVGALSKGKSGIDMACGSGYFTRALKKSGYSIIGVDSSVEMLDEAVKISKSQGLDIPFLSGDMTSFKNFKKVDFITVVNDGVNYLPPERVLKTFKHFSALLKKGGVLLFDVSSEYKLKNVIADNLFAEDREDLTYLWFNKLSDNKVDMDLSVFIKKGDLYEKKEECQTQYIHTVDFLTDCLQKSGYSTVNATNHLGGTIKTDSLRIQFTAIKD